MSNKESSFEYKPMETEICGLSIHSNTSSEQMFYSPIQEVNESQTNIIEDSLNNIKINKKQKDLNNNCDFNSLESIRISHSTFSHENNSILENHLNGPSKFNKKTSQMDLFANEENLNIYQTPKKKNKIETEYIDVIKNKNIYKFNNVELIPDVFKNSETNKKVMVSELDIKLSLSTAKQKINDNNIPTIKGRVLEDDFKAQLEQNLKDFFIKKAKNKEKNNYNEKISNTCYNKIFSNTQRECSNKTKSFYKNIEINNNKNNTHRNKNNNIQQKSKLNNKKNNFSLFKTKTTTNKQNNKTKKIYNNIKRVNSSKGIHSLIKKITSFNNKFLNNKNLLFKNITEYKNNNNINKTRNTTLNKNSVENKSIKKKGSTHSNNSLTNCSSNKNSNKNSDKYSISTKLSSNKNNKNNDINHKKITPFSCKNEFKTVKYFHQNKNLHNNILNKNIEINFSNISKNSKKYENSYRQSSVNSQKHSNNKKMKLFLTDYYSIKSLINQRSSKSIIKKKSKYKTLNSFYQPKITKKNKKIINKLINFGNKTQYKLSVNYTTLKKDNNNTKKTENKKSLNKIFNSSKNKKPTIGIYKNNLKFLAFTPFNMNIRNKLLEQKINKIHKENKFKINKTIENINKNITERHNINNYNSLFLQNENFNTINYSNNLF